MTEPLAPRPSIWKLVDIDDPQPIARAANTVTLISDLTPSKYTAW